MRTKLSSFALLFSLLHAIQPLKAQIVSIDIDTIAVHTGVVGGADLTGYTTYRFYAVMANAESKLLDIYGHVDHPLLFGSTGSIWNFELNAQIFEPSTGVVANYPQAGFDSWFDLENVNQPISSNLFFDDWNQPSISFKEMFFQTTPESEALQTLMSPLGSALSNYTPTSSDATLRIRFAQITTNGSPQYQLNFHSSLLDCSGEIQSQTFTNGEYVFGCNDPLACNFDPTMLDIDYNTCVFPGCLDPDAINYSPTAGCPAECIDSGPCTDQMACNYDPTAIYQDFSNCEYPGCSDPLASNYVPDPFCEGVCIYAPACPDPEACNYVPNPINPDYAICTYPGCSDPEALNYTPNNGCPSECIYTGPCSNQLACNYDPTAIYQDFSTCEYPGCSDPLAINYSSSPPCEGPCIYVGPCTDEEACNYDPSAIYPDSSTCTYPGCTNPYGINYSPDAGCNGDCIFPCASSNACNYDPNFVVYYTSNCVWPGCWDPNATNYNPNAPCGGGNCLYPCLDPNACNYLMNAVACRYSTTTFYTYYDMDEDGLLTSNDPEIHYPFEIHFPDLNITRYSYGGNTIPIQIPPPVDFIYMSNNQWDVVGPNEMTITTGCSTMDILVTEANDPWRNSFSGSELRTAGLLPGNNSVSYTFRHWLNLPVQYNCTLGFDPILPLLHPITNEVVLGNSYNFSVTGIFDQSTYHRFKFQIPTEELIGTTIENTLSCIATDQLGVELFSFEDEISRVVMGPYDPNIKIDEPAGWHEPEFIAPDADLTYTIYFQNNGNAPAERVVVVDSLDVNSYDLSTLEILYASDTLSYMLDLTSGVVTFTFDEIYLPDSLSDPEGSIGYFQYRIAPLNNLPHMHEIRNKAYIYFDNNSPIITPSTLQTIFDCASLERESIDLALCPGDSIDVEAFADYIDGVQWSLNDTWLSDTNTLVIDSLPSGDHILHYTFSNPGCEVTNDIHITIAPTLIVQPYYTPDGYTTGFDDLYHTWFFNDEEIIGNNTSVFDSNWPDYAHYGLGVIVTDANGCSHSYYEYFIDVNEMEIAKLTWYPNPVSDYLTLHYEGNINDLRKIEILNALGQVVSTPQIVMSNSSLMIDMHTLPDGMYVLQVNGQALTNSKVIKN